MQCMFIVQVDVTTPLGTIFHIHYVPGNESKIPSAVTSWAGQRPQEVTGGARLKKKKPM